MKRVVCFVVCVLIPSCGGRVDVAGEDGGGNTRPCDPSKPFGPLRPLTELNTPEWETNAQLSPDELTIYFFRRWHLYVATRVRRTMSFSSAVELDDVGNSFAISPDGQTLYLENPTQTLGRYARSGTDFVPTDDKYFLGRHPYFANESSLYYDNGRAILKRTRVGTQWGPANELPDLNGNQVPVVTPDERTIYFWNSGGLGASVIYTAHREDAKLPFSSPSEVRKDVGAPTWISPDDCRLYVSHSSNAGQDTDLYVLERSP